jgi:GMP synthase (glutamine-hydrolysing)
MPTWTVLQHVAFEHPGLIAEIAAGRGVELDVRRMELGDEVPALDEVEGLVVMGGPMGALDDVVHRNLSAERALLAGAAGFGLPVLAVCLGAQLLANLPEAVLLPESERVAVEAYGRGALGRFFDLVL